MKREIVTYLLRLGQDTIARVYVNDIPLLDGTSRGQLSSRGGLNDRLIAGENEVRVELLRCPPAPIGDPPEDPKEAAAHERLRRGFELWIFKARPGTKGQREEDLETILRFHFPDVWDEEDPERRRLPFHHVVRFDPEVDVHRLAYLDAPEDDAIPCEGTRELREVVEALHSALQARDKDRLIELMRLQIHEGAAAFEGTGPAVATQLEAYDEFFADEVDVLPLAKDQLHFTPRAGGRVVEVTRFDEQPVLAAVTRNTHMSHTSNPLLTRVDGQWRLM